MELGVETYGPGNLECAARVWEEMVYSNMRAHYFGDLIRTYQERDKWFREQIEIGLKSVEDGKTRPANEFFNELESRIDDKQS